MVSVARQGLGGAAQLAAADRTEWEFGQELVVLGPMEMAAVQHLSP